MKNQKKINKKIPSFEEILKLFMDMDSDEKTLSFQQVLKRFLTTKTEEDRRFLGTIFLALTRDTAYRLLRSIEQRGDIAMLEEMQQMLTEFA